MLILSVIIIVKVLARVSIVAIVFYDRACSETLLHRDGENFKCRGGIVKFPPRVLRIGFFIILLF